MNTKPRRATGQSIVEYVIIFAAIIAAVVAVGGAFQGKVTQVITDSVNKIP